MERMHVAQESFYVRLHTKYECNEEISRSGKKVL